MIFVKFNGRAHSVPNRWRDFDCEFSKQFCLLCKAFESFESGQSSFDEFRAQSTMALLGIENADDIRANINSAVFETLFRVGELTDFYYRLDEDAKLAFLDICIPFNVMPEIKGVKGYVFRHNDDGHFDCNLAAEQYVKAIECIQEYGRSRSVAVLELLASVLYPGVRKVGHTELLAVYYNFRGILQYIQSLPNYSLIFHSVELEPVENPVGMMGTIYTLSRTGYGDIEAMKSMDVFTYLDLLLQQSIDCIRSYAAMKLKPTEIAEKMNIPTEMVLRFVGQKP